MIELTKMGHRDLPQALVLLNEMNVSAQHVAAMVDAMIQKVRKGELTTDQGLSFLEVKYNMLLSYLINLSYVVLRKCSGEHIETDPCIGRLIEIRTVLERIRPIDQKLKYQIDKLVKSAVTGTNLDSLKTSADNFEASSSEDSDEEVAKKKVYVPPKLAANHFMETSQEKTKRLEEKNKKKMISSSLLQDLREEYLDTPVEIAQGSRAQQILTKEQRERQEYEEEYMTRLPITKAEKHRNRQLTTLGTLGDEIANFSANRKRQKSYKSKGGGGKRKRFH